MRGRNLFIPAVSAGVLSAGALAIILLYSPVVNKPLALGLSVFSSGAFLGAAYMAVKYANDRASGINEPVDVMAVLRTAPSAVLELDRNGIVTSCNIAAADLLGYTEPELLGIPFISLVPEGSHALFRIFLNGLLSGRSASGMEVPFIARSGEASVIEINSSPVFKEGGLRGLRLFIRDAGEIKRLGRELSALKGEHLYVKERLEKVTTDLEAFTLLALRRETKMKEIRERLKTSKEAFYTDGPLRH